MTSSPKRVMRGVRLVNALSAKFPGSTVGIVVVAAGAVKVEVLAIVRYGEAMQLSGVFRKAYCMSSPRCLRFRESMMVVASSMGGDNE